MDVKAFPALIVGVVVALVLAGATLPIWADTLATEDTFNNVGYYDLTYTETDNITLVWDHTKPKQVTVNNEVIALPDGDGYQKTIICGDDWLIRYGAGSPLGTFVQYYGSSGGSILASEQNGYDMTMICSSGSATVTDTASTPNTVTVSYTYLYVVDDKGAYVMKKMDDSAYMVGDSPIYAMGLTNVGTYTSTGIVISGTIDDGVTWDTFRGDGFTFSDQEINYTEVDNYKGLYKLDSMTATITKEGQTANAVYSYFIVPATVTAERSVSMAGPLGVLVGVIPLLMVAGLVTGAVVWFINRKG